MCRQIQVGFSGTSFQPLSRMIETVRYGSELMIDEVDLGQMPIFISATKLFWEPTAWLISRHHNGLAMTSVRTYAGHLLDLYRQLEVDQIGIERLDDAYLKAYHRALLVTAPESAGQYIRTVLEYVQWLESEEIVAGLVGDGEGFRINPKFHVTSYKGPAAIRSERADAPSHQAIDIVKANLEVQKHCFLQRDELMMEWQQGSGLRASEVCGLGLSDLPSRELVERRAADGLIRVRVRGKGGRYRKVNVAPSLMFKTLDWKETGREAIVKGLSSSDAASDILFIAKSGRALSPKTLSNKIRAACVAARAAGLIDAHDRVWSHGLRHRFATDDHQHRNEAGQSRAAFHTKQQLGHRNIGTTGVYLHDTAPGEVLDERRKYKTRRKT